MVKYIAGIYCIVMLFGCRYAHYALQTQNVPFFKEKDEVKYSTIISGHAIGLMSAYAYSDKNALQANFFYSQNFTTLGILDFYSSHNSYEGGLAYGWYKAKDEKRRFEIFIGDHVKFSKESSGSGGGHILKSAYNKLFVQPSFGKSSTYLDFAVTPALGYMYMFKLDLYDDDGRPMPLSYHKMISRIENKRHSLLFEPGITLRIGGQYTKLQIQMVGSINLIHDGLPYDDLSISLGLFGMPIPFRK
ncbi:MAG: hypothetical protein LC107_13930 [Chitinophagales bacterium]|nr:hypothetical protein [Chitinophagales bacterium]